LFYVRRKVGQDADLLWYWNMERVSASRSPTRRLSTLKIKAVFRALLK
jgi:hypothetical protein